VRPIVLGSVLLVACVSDNPAGDAGPAQGALGGKCFSNGTCNAGLVCVVPDMCVLPDAGPDVSVDAPTESAADTSTTDSGDAASACPTTALVTFWKGENGTSDEEGYLNLQGQGGPTYVTGHSGMAFSFGGTSYLEAPAGQHSTLPAVTTTLTIEAWINPSNVSSGTIFSRRSDQGSGYEFRIESSHLVFQTNNFTLTGTATLAVALAYHVAVTVGSSSMQLYFDGAADGSPFPITNGVQSADTASVRVGSGWGPAQVTKSPYTGWIDEVAVYANALSSQEIAALYAGGTKCH
jgi:hypothetical protein